MFLLKFLYTLFYWAVIVIRWTLITVLVAYYLDVFLKVHKFGAAVLPSLDHCLSVGYGFLSFLFINLILHEMAQGYCALLLRLSVRRCILGFPIPVSYVSFLWLPWQLSTAYPNLCMTQYGYVEKTALRLRIAFMLLAGLFVNALVFVGCGFEYLQLIAPTHGASLTTPHLNFLAGAAAATVYVLIGHLIPLAYKTDGKPFRSDTYQIFALPFLSETQMDETIYQTRMFLEFDKLGMDVPTRLTPAEAAEALKDHPDNALLLVAIAPLCSEADPELSLKILRRVLEAGIDQPNARLSAIDGYLRLALERNLCSTDPLVDELSAELVKLSQRSLASVTIRGAVLVDRGDVSQGVPLLYEVQHNAGNDVDRVYCLTFLILAERAAGRINEAAEFERKLRAVKSYKHYRIVKRAM